MSGMQIKILEFNWKVQHGHKIMVTDFEGKNQGSLLIFLIPIIG